MAGGAEGIQDLCQDIGRLAISNDCAPGWGPRAPVAAASRAPPAADRAPTAADRAPAAVSRTLLAVVPPGPEALQSTAGVDCSATKERVVYSESKQEMMEVFVDEGGSKQGEKAFQLSTGEVLFSARAPTKAVLQLYRYTLLKHLPTSGCTIRDNNSIKRYLMGSFRGDQFDKNADALTRCFHEQFEATNGVFYTRGLPVNKFEYSHLGFSPSAYSWMDTI